MKKAKTAKKGMGCMKKAEMVKKGIGRMKKAETAKKRKPGASKPSRTGKAPGAAPSRPDKPPYHSVESYIERLKRDYKMSEEDIERLINQGERTEGVLCLRPGPPLMCPAPEAKGEETP